jgi:hypothetical protein
MKPVPNRSRPAVTLRGHCDLLPTTLIIIITIIVKNKKDKTCLLIDVTIPSDKNVTQKEAERKLKYKNLSIEIQRMWNMKCFIIPVIIGATGIVSKSLQKYLETIPGQHSIDSLQKLPY